MSLVIGIISTMFHHVQESNDKINVSTVIEPQGQILCQGGIAANLGVSWICQCGSSESCSFHFCFSFVYKSKLKGPVVLPMKAKK